MAKIHYRNIRLLVNAGMVFPECKAYAKLLDLYAGYWNITHTPEKVTCKNCIKQMKRRML